MKSTARFAPANRLPLVLLNLVGVSLYIFGFVGPEPFQYLRQPAGAGVHLPGELFMCIVVAAVVVPLAIACLGLLAPGQLRRKPIGN